MTALMVTFVLGIGALMLATLKELMERLGDLFVLTSH